MAEQQERTPGIIDQAKAAYEQVVCAIIRPPRTTYDERHLGPRRFQCINNAARDALVDAGVAKVDANGASGSGKSGKKSGVAKEAGVTR